MAASVLAGAGYLLQAKWTLGLGLPLDDAWIHQTYARNLVERGEWAFQPGEPSAGSTAPLWTLILAIGRWLGLDPLAWTYAAGIALLVMTAWTAGRWLSHRQPGLRGWAIAAAALVVFEWHLVWASVSGMETLALAFIALLVLLAVDQGDWPALGVGLCLGAGLWIRPDALLLAVPVTLAGVAHTTRQPRGSWPGLPWTFAVAAPLIGAYLAFNHSLSGEWWPTTFYAKQAEYAVLRARPLLTRLFEQAQAPLVGMGMVLLPGLALAVVRDVRERKWARLAAPLWIALHLAAYAVRLPVTYQHGRYALPVIPALLVLGLDGLATWARPLDSRSLRRRLSRAWLGSLLAVAAGFYLLGARAYARDVAIIESEMVAASRWIAEHTEPGALVAAHDIGALGYFGDRPLVDLAGLVSPEVVPILRDEAVLARYLDERRAEYLMTFPGWYPILVQNAELVFTTRGSYSPTAGGENMAVFRWRAASFARPAPAVLYSFQSTSGRDAHGNHRGHYR